MISRTVNIDLHQSRGIHVEFSVVKQRSIAVQDCCPSVLEAPLTDADAEVLARSFAAMADPVRLKLLSLIASRDEVCACELVEPVGRSQPTVSHHLRILFEAGLVERERRGTWIWYRVVPTQLEAMRAALAGSRPLVDAASASSPFGS
jgi:ArsR family transcriptional regulator, arsenate/arsenite/antimonite-responsive transcriptional repressor